MKRQFMVIPEKLSAFSDGELAEGVWIQAAPMGTFHHPVYGEAVIDDVKIDRYIQHFEQNIYGQEPPISYEHFGMDASKGHKAAGWVKSMERREDGMWWLVAFTEEATTEVRNGEWRYFSPEWYDEWTDPATQITYKDVPAGGALTNNPFYKNMVPLNFSELAAEVASLPATNEVADWEHSEPGSGPTPREDVEDDNNTQGTRGISPDQEPDPDAYDVEDSMDEFLEKLAELLKLEGEPTEETVLAAFTERMEQVAPITAALDEANEKQTFSERYPVEFQKMQSMETRIRDSDAKAFAEKYTKARVVKTEGEGEEATTETTPYGFSALAVERIEKLHKAFSENRIQESDISDVLDAVMDNGLVDYSERGTTRVEDTDALEPDSVKAAFAEKVVAIVREDKVDHAAAIRIATDKHPELARRYAEATRSK
jgi:phage I-like protein